MTNKEATSVIKSECYIFNPLDFDSSTMVNTLEKQDSPTRILKMIKEEMKE